MPDSALRQLLLRVTVLDDIDLDIADHALTLQTGDRPVRVQFSSLLAAVGGAPLDSERARARVAGWLRLRGQLAEHDSEDILDSVRPLGMPVRHPLHPGWGFALHRVLGGALDLGAGLLGLDPDLPEQVTLIPPSLWSAIRVDPRQVWPSELARLERMGELAAERWRLDPSRLLRPMGDCDVVTLLASFSLRAVLAGASRGMCPAVVPMRTRGWTNLSRMDPAFAPAAAAATDPPERGFDRPLLITASEVVMARDGGRAITLSLADPAPAYERSPARG